MRMLNRVDVNSPGQASTVPALHLSLSWGCLCAALPAFEAPIPARTPLSPFLRCRQVLEQELQASVSPSVVWDDVRISNNVSQVLSRTSL